MNGELVLRVIQEGLYLSLLLSAPAVLAALLVGTLISVLQAATQINDPSVASVPKTIVVFGVIALVGLWVLQQLVAFAQALLAQIPTISG
ncbi:MAG: flagellar biosynthetic protein FliQ [Phycisphaerales bacterium]